MVDTDRLAEVRAFVRSCNVLLKQAALYGLKHTRCAAQFEASWKDLRKAVENGSKVALAVAGDKLMLDGAPLACGTAERSLAGFLAAAGIGRIVFYPTVCPDEFQELIEIFSSSKPPEVLAKLKPELGKTIGNIRVHEFRLMESSGEGADGEGGSGGSDGISTGLDLGVLLSDPHKLLQLIGAVDTPSAGAASASGQAAPGSNFHEGNVLGAIRWLTSFAGGGGKEASAAVAAGASGGFAGSGLSAPGSPAGAALSADAGAGLPGEVSGSGAPAGVTGREVPGGFSAGGVAGGVPGAGRPAAGFASAAAGGVPGAGSPGEGSGPGPGGGEGSGEAALAAGSSAADGFSGGQESEKPTELQRALQKILPKKPGRELRGALLLQLAEQVALRAVNEKYQREGLNVTAIQQMLERMNQEIDRLRRVLHAREREMGRAGLIVERDQEVLDSEFWRGVPESAKRKVLLSSDVWVVPPHIIRSFVQPLLATRADIDVATAVLRNYCRFLESEDRDARAKTSAGVGKLADLYSRLGQLDGVIQLVGELLAREIAGEFAPALKESFVLLGQEAASAGNYASLDEWLYVLEDLARRDPALAADIRSRVPLDARVPAMVRTAIQQPQPPEAIIDVLKRVPDPTARYVIEQFASCTKREEGIRLARVLSVLGPVSIDPVREMLLRGSPEDAIAALGLLSVLEPEFLLQELPARISAWTRAQQDAALRQIAAAGTEERGALMLSIINSLDPFVLPLAVDEIGMAGGVPPQQLMHLAQGRGPAHDSPYLQVKAIEALGRLREKLAAPVLTSLLTARSLLSWQQPREIRIVAAQALQRIDSGAARPLIAGSGLSDRELLVGPASDVNPLWIRQRKYSRVRAEKELLASLLAPTGASSVKIQAISLGGGIGSTVRDAQGITDTELDLFIGLRKLPTRVFVRRARPHELCFEFVDISLDDRGRLRGFVAERTRTVAHTLYVRS